MSAPSGFVITVSCEDFFKDARKSVALFFNEERMKTVNDLKQRLRILVNTDFYVLWGPCDEESYYYLLEDEKLHFVKPKDKFRICKITKSSTELFNNNIYNHHTTVAEKNVSPKEIIDSEQENTNHKSNGILEKAKDDDLLMEYEDVVDEGSKKKRKRIRKHKSKKLKLENSTNNVDASNTLESTYIHIPDTSRDDKITDNVVEQNSRSHIHFEAENLNSYDQVDTEQITKIDNSQINGGVKSGENVRKKDKKKKNQDTSLFEVSEQFLSHVKNESNENATAEPASVGSSKSSITNNIATSTACNTPTSAIKKRTKKRPTHSLASFISQLSDSLKQPTNNTNGVADNTEDKAFIKNEASCTSNNTNKQILLSNTEEKHDEIFKATVDKETSNSFKHVIYEASTKNKSKNIFNRHPSPSNNSYSPTVNNKSIESSYTNRKLRRNLKKLDEDLLNGNELSVLENLKQLKYSNSPSMPLVFERNFSHGRECVTNEIGGIADISNVNGKGDIANNERNMNEIEEIVNDVSNGNAEMSNNITNGIDGTVDNVANGIMKELSMKTNVSFPFPGAYERLQEMTEEQLAPYPLLKEPTENQVLIFKVLKMDASYNPSLSNYVGALVKSVCKTTKQLSLHIVFGSEELKPPIGKFSLEDEEEDRELTEHSLNWNEMFHSRNFSSQMYDQHCEPALLRDF